MHFSKFYLKDIDREGVCERERERKRKRENPTFHPHSCQGFDGTKIKRQEFNPGLPCGRQIGTQPLEPSLAAAHGLY